MKGERELVIISSDLLLALRGEMHCRDPPVTNSSPPLPLQSTGDSGEGWVTWKETLFEHILHNDMMCITKDYFGEIKIFLLSSTVCFMTRNIFSLIFEISEIEQGLEYLEFGGGGGSRPIIFPGQHTLMRPNYILSCSALPWSSLNLNPHFIMKIEN